MKNVLVLSDSAPYQQHATRESLDTALIFAAIEQNISWLLRGSAVLTLKKAQQPHQLEQKDFTKAINMLHIYDVEQVYVCEASLAQFSLTSADLFFPATVLTPSEQQQLINTQDMVVTLWNQPAYIL